MLQLLPCGALDANYVQVDVHEPKNAGRERLSGFHHT
jgi:hypothetical protein